MKPKKAKIVCTCCVLNESIQAYQRDYFGHPKKYIKAGLIHRCNHPKGPKGWRFSPTTPASCPLTIRRIRSEIKFSRFEEPIDYLVQRRRAVERG
jgi:hypothetical protein